MTASGPPLTPRPMHRFENTFRRICAHCLEGPFPYEYEDITLVTIRAQFHLQRNH